MTEPNPLYANASEAARMYFEAMDAARLKRIEELEAELGYRSQDIQQRNMDIKHWRDRALYNSKWKGTMEEIRTVVLALAFMAAATYYIHLKLGGNIPLYPTTCTLQEVR